MPETQPLAFGTYLVERELGRGGMGVVYAATHEVLGKRAAVKVLRSDVSRDPESIERFMNEARAASAIEHPSIVEVFDVGHEDDTVYIVMELLQGESLASRLKTRGALSIASAIGLARQCANALEAAHQAGIVHRDLKPDNVFLVPDEEVAGGERVKLLDFGVAKLLGDGPSASVARTVTGALLGTPHYMSPEQCEGAREVDARSDLYSLGCMLFQMVSGKLPFNSPGIGGLIGMHLHVPPPTLHSVRPDAPAELDALVARLLAKAPDERIQTASEVAELLAGMSTSSTTRVAVEPAPLSSVVDVASPTMATVAAIAAAPVEPVRRRSRAALWFGLVGVSLAAVAVAILVTRSPDAPEPSPITRAEQPPQPAPQPPLPVPAPTPVPSPPPVDPVASEVAIANSLLEDGDFGGAQAVLRHILARAPDHAEARKVEQRIKTARAGQEIEAMKAAFPSAKPPTPKQLDQVKRGHAAVYATTRDPQLRKEADRLWAQARPLLVDHVRKEIDGLAKQNKCAQARTVYEQRKDLVADVEPQITKCENKQAEAKLAAERLDQAIAVDLRYIGMTENPISVIQACHRIATRAPARTPWETCMKAQCQVNPKGSRMMIARAPTYMHEQLLAMCR